MLKVEDKTRVAAVAPSAIQATVAGRSRRMIRRIAGLDQLARYLVETLVQEGLRPGGYRRGGARRDRGGGVAHSAPETVPEQIVYNVDPAQDVPVAGVVAQALRRRGHHARVAALGSDHAHYVRPTTVSGDGGELLSGLLRRRRAGPALAANGAVAGAVRVRG